MMQWIVSCIRANRVIPDLRRELRRPAFFPLEFSFFVLSPSTTQQFRIIDHVTIVAVLTLCLLKVIHRVHLVTVAVQHGLIMISTIACRRMIKMPMMAMLPSQAFVLSDTDPWPVVRRARRRIVLDIDEVPARLGQELQLLSLLSLSGAQLSIPIGVKVLNRYVLLDWSIGLVGMGLPLAHKHRPHCILLPVSYWFIYLFAFIGWPSSGARVATPGEAKGVSRWNGTAFMRDTLRWNPTAKAVIGIILGLTSMTATLNWSCEQFLVSRIILLFLLSHGHQTLGEHGGVLLPILIIVFPLTAANTMLPRGDVRINFAIAIWRLWTILALTVFVNVGLMAVAIMGTVVCAAVALATLASTWLLFAPKLDVLVVIVIDGIYHRGHLVFYLGPVHQPWFRPPRRRPILLILNGYEISIYLQLLMLTAIVVGCHLLSLSWYAVSCLLDFVRFALLLQILDYCSFIKYILMD